MYQQTAILMNCFTHMKLSNWCIDKTNTINTFTARYIITTLNIKKTICTCCYMWPLFMKQWHKIQCNITYWILRRHPVNTWSVNSQPSGDQLIWIDQKLVDSQETVGDVDGVLLECRSWVAIGGGHRHSTSDPLSLARRPLNFYLYLIKSKVYLLRKSYPGIFLPWGLNHQVPMSVAFPCDKPGVHRKQHNNRCSFIVLQSLISILKSI